MHPKIQQFVDNHLAESKSELELLKAKLEQYEKFDAQKAEIEQVVNALTQENIELKAQLDEVNAKAAAFEKSLDEAKQTIEKEQAQPVPAPGKTSKQSKK
jgi:chromosome segregation ATPase